MKQISKFLLQQIGWKIKGDFPNISKSIIITAPHTSNWDIIIGKLYLNAIGIDNKVLVKKEFFFFPVNLIMRFLGTLPVDRNNKKNNIIYQAASYFKENDSFFLGIAAEGTRRRTNIWKQGFFYIAQKAKVPIVVNYIDYKKKEIGVKGVITDTSNKNEAMAKIMEMYKDVNAKYPENFVLDKRFNDFL